MLVVGSGKNGPNSAGGIDVDSAHVTTVGSGSVSSGNTTNFVNSLPSYDIQKNLFASPQLHQCTSNDAERSNLVALEGDTEGDWLSCTWDEFD